jgi:hypothetical protein
LSEATERMVAAIASVKYGAMLISLLQITQ